MKKKEQEQLNTLFQARKDQNNLANPRRITETSAPKP